MSKLSKIKKKSTHKYTHNNNNTEFINAAQELMGEGPTLQCVTLHWKNQLFLCHLLSIVNSFSVQNETRCSFIFHCWDPIWLQTDFSVFQSSHYFVALTQGIMLYLQSTIYNLIAVCQCINCILKFLSTSTVLCGFSVFYAMSYTFLKFV